MLAREPAVNQAVERAFSRWANPREYHVISAD
jgi:hypothetical protein